MDALQLEIDALAGEWRRQERKLNIAAPPMWYCSIRGCTAFLCYSGQWVAEFWSGPLAELDGEVVEANGPTAADALRALVVEVRRVADACAADAAAIESLVSGDAEGDAPEDER